MSVLVWIIIGILAGWIASLIMDADSGLLRNIIIGTVGALIGGFVMSYAGGEGFAGFNVWSFLVALMGAIILLGGTDYLSHHNAP